MTVDWGARSNALRSLHAKLSPVRSFLLANAPLPVRVGTMKVTDTGIAWDIAPVTALTVTAVAGTDTATFAVPAGAKYLRLDFKLELTIGTTTATCLEFRQLLAVAPGEALLPERYSIENLSFRRGTPVPVAVRDKGPQFTGRRAFLGRCPLLDVAPDRLEVNCEFLDVTELWWATWGPGDRWGWYLDGDLRGRPDRLRVLAWTSGVPPLIWFAAVSDLAATGKGPPAQAKDSGAKTKEASGQASAKPAQTKESPAAKPTSRAGADIVFFRPQAGFNAFFHKPTEKGFLDSRHGDTTMFHLARWLLAPLQEPALKAKLAKSAGAVLPFRVDYAGMRIKPASTPPPDPPEPLDRVADDVRWAFRLVGIEPALENGTSPDVVLLPVGFDGVEGSPLAAGGGYTALLAKNAFRAVVDSARKTLWVRGAVGTHLNATPSFDRQLWLTGHSRGNAQMFTCLAGNAADVDLVVSYDATPAATLLVPTGVPAVTAAAAARAKAGKKLKAVFVTTPNMWKDKNAYEDIKKKVAATKADVLMLPPDAGWDAYWQYPPTAKSNPHLLEVLKEWEGTALTSSKKMGTRQAGQQWLFWHEWAVHGGHLVMDSATPPGIVRVRTFFEDVLLLP